LWKRLRSVADQDFAPESQASFSATTSSMSTSEASVQVLPSYQEYHRPALTEQWLEEV
jgi:hypothetical protein